MYIKSKLAIQTVDNCVLVYSVNIKYNCALYRITKVTEPL